MSEKKQLKDVVIKFIILGVFAFLYSLGGMEDGGGKWLRRFIAPCILCGGMVYFSGDWKPIIQAPLMMITLCLGYGANMEIIKIFKRFIFGLTNGLTSSTINLLRKKFLLVGTQVILLASLSVIFGVYNPLPNARTEEFCIGLVIGFIPIMSANREGL